MIWYDMLVNHHFITYKIWSKEYSHKHTHRIYTSPGQAVIMAMQDKRNTT